jgi:hypothetical protein
MATETTNNYSATVNLHISHITAALDKPFPSLLCLQQPYPSNVFWQWRLFSVSRSRRYCAANIPQLNFCRLPSTAPSLLRLPCRVRLRCQPSTELTRSPTCSFHFTQLNCQPTTQPIKVRVLYDWRFILPDIYQKTIMLLFIRAITSPRCGYSPYACGFLSYRKRPLTQLASSQSSVLAWEGWQPRNLCRVTWNVKAVQRGIKRFSGIFWYITSYIVYVILLNRLFHALTRSKNRSEGWSRLHSYLMSQ